MPQSLVRNYIHLVFSTKNRMHVLDETIQPDLCSYLAGICRNLDCYPVQIGGYTNHVHALLLQSKKLPLINVVEEIKAHFPGWIKTKGETYRQFY